jgi:uncharacterized membrane protein
MFPREGRKSLLGRTAGVVAWWDRQAPWPPVIGRLRGLGGVVVMTHQQAVSVVAAPLDTVERQLRDVLQWPGFLLGLEKVTETSFQRYTFVVKDGNSSREVDVAVVAHPGEHRMVWHALKGARFDGDVRLTAVDATHTRVHLSLIADPQGFLAALSDFVRSSSSTATLDLQRLEGVVTGAGH